MKRGKLGSITAACIALSINMAPYVPKMLCGAILSVTVIGGGSYLLLGRQAMFRFLIPQAVRVAISPLGNTCIGMLKETLRVSIVAVTELLRSSQLLIMQY